MNDMAKPLGALLPGIANPECGETVSQPPSTMPSQVLDLASLPARLDDSMMAMLREIRTSPLPAPVSCDDDAFAKCMKLMDILPRRQDDQLTGKLRFALYKRHLSGFSNEALAYLANKATSELHWFPLPVECLSILKVWPNATRDADRKEKAGHLIQRENQARLEEALVELKARTMSQEDVDALPEFTKRVGETKGYLRLLTDGSYRVWPDIFGATAEQLEAHRAMAAQLHEEGLL